MDFIWFIISLAMVAAVGWATMSMIAHIVFGVANFASVARRWLRRLL